MSATMRRWLWHPGTPRAKARPRLGQRRDGSVWAFTPATTHAEEWLVGYAWRQKYPDDLPLACPVAVNLICVGGGADADNAAKLVLDALNGIAYVDDRLVKRLTVRRLESGACPMGTYIEVRPMAGPWRKQLARRLLRLVERSD